MDWLNALTEKWFLFREKIRPTTEKVGAFFKRLGKDLSKIFDYMYKLRAIILAAPVAAAAAVLASINISKLPDAVEITKLAYDTKAEDSLFGCLVISVDYISKQEAILLPLVLTIVCLLLTMCSKRAFFPWVISVFSLALPVLLMLSNLYPA